MELNKRELEILLILWHDGKPYGSNAGLPCIIHEFKLKKKNTSGIQASINKLRKLKLVKEIKNPHKTPNIIQYSKRIFALTEKGKKYLKINVFTSKKIEQTVKKMKQDAIRIGKTTRDGGSCNMDKCLVFNADATLIKALKKENLSTYKHENELYIHAPIMSQGFANTAQVELFTKALRSMGYTTYTDYKMD